MHRLRSEVSHYKNESETLQMYKNESETKLHDTIVSNEAFCEKQQILVEQLSRALSDAIAENSMVFIHSYRIECFPNMQNIAYTAS